RDVEADAGHERVPLGIERRAGVAAGVGGMAVQQRELPERRGLIAPGLPAVEGPGVAAVVEPEARVVLPRNEVVVVERIDDDDLLGLTAERAGMVHANDRATMPDPQAAARNGP